MDKIINLCNWCNVNEGLVSAMLTVMTIIISVIALFVSIKHGIDLNGNMTIEVHEYGGKVHKFKRGFPVG